jgi:hypothetical protein
MLYSGQAPQGSTGRWQYPVFAIAPTARFRRAHSSKSDGEKRNLQLLVYYRLERVGIGMQQFFRNMFPLRGSEHPALYSII